MVDDLPNLIYSVRRGRTVSRAEHTLDQARGRLFPGKIMSGFRVSCKRLSIKALLDQCVADALHIQKSTKDNRDENPSASSQSRKKDSRRKEKEQERNEFYEQALNGNDEDMASSSMSLGKFYNHLGRIASLFDAHGDIDDLTRKHARDLEQEKRIENLQLTIETLEHQYRERTKHLQEENCQLKNEKVGNERVRNELEQERAELNEYAARKEEEFRVRVDMQEKRWEDHAGRIEQELVQKHEAKKTNLERRLKLLQIEKQSLEENFQEVNATSEEERRQWQRDSKMHHECMSQLETKVQNLEAEFAVESKPVEY